MTNETVTPTAAHEVPQGRFARALRTVADVFRDQRDERTRARARYPYLDWQA